MSRARQARRGGEGRRWHWPRASSVARLALGLGTWAGLSLILLGYGLFPGRVELRVGQRSPTLVRAPRTVQYVDLEATERLRQEAEARAAESPQYTPLPYALADAESRLRAAWEELTQLRRSAPPEAGGRLLPLLPEEGRAWARRAGQADLEQLRAHAEAIVRQVMAKEIREGTADLGAAKQEAEALARRRAGDPGAAAALAALARIGVGPNRQYDREATRAAQEEARARVQEVVRTIAADQPVVFAGERVTRQHLAMLRALGLTSPRFDYRRLASIALIVGLMVVMLAAQTRRWARPVYDRPKLLLLLSLLLVGSLFLVHLVTLSLPHVWMLVVPAATLMAAVLLAEELGLGVALLLSVSVGLMPSGGLLGALLSLGSATVALSYVSLLWPVSRLRWIVGAMAAANLVLAVAAGLLQGQPAGSIAREAALASLLYSPGAAALSLGGIFLLQRPFGVTTHLGLLELSNPRHPLLRRMQQEAPGTYYASMMVADLADAAAEAVGADPLLARVGALYHDVGKLRRPAFFVENQGLLGTDNVHDRLSSSLSGLIIMSHVKDGVELAREYRLPPEVVDIVEQHHGRTLVSYFYQRALTGERPESVTEDAFRYPGPVPHTKEAALVMLADSVQAAAKSISEPTPQRVQQMVRDIVRDRLVDGQLAECDLTFRDVAAAEAVMGRVLSALLCHGRIEYPEPAGASAGR